jgi:hypothetical protein
MNTYLGHRAAAVTVAMLTLASPAVARTFKVIHTFTGAPSDGANPMAGLVADAQGNLYGTTQVGGKNKFGTAFELSPPVQGATGWTETILYHFNSPESSQQFNDIVGAPTTSLVFDSEGALYGTTGPYYNSGEQLIYKLTPTTSGTGWTPTLLMSVQAHPTGGEYFGRVALGANGNIFDIASGGGKYGFGTIFELLPRSDGHYPTTAETIHNFSDSEGGGAAPLVSDTEGNFYGSSATSVYRLSPPPAGKLSWVETTIYSSSSHEMSGLTLDAADGNLYGICEYCGSFSKGSVLKLSPPTSGTLWTVSTLYTFGGKAGDGTLPTTSVTVGPDGNLYGVTSAGGTYGYGAVYELKRSKTGLSWSEEILHSATSGSLGTYLNGDLVVDAQGNVYGTTPYGGNKSLMKGSGVVYEILAP